MNITRNNYENFFLLYADGELDPAAMQEVDNFVALHPDLAEELEMLMDTILPGDYITMPAKEKMLKPELWDEENISYRQEALLLLLDNELQAEEAKNLEADIAADDSLQKEWNILQQSRLIESTVEMPGKETLYRHEKDRNPIPIGGWVKWMAAAAVIAGMGWFGFSRMSNDTQVDAPTVAVNRDQEPTVPAKNPASPVEEAPTQKEPVINTSSNTATNEAIIVPGKQATEKVSIPAVKKNETNIAQYAVNENTQLVQVVPETSIPTNAIATIDTKEISNPILTFDNPETSATIAQQALYNEDAADEDADYVNIAGAKIKKQKLRGVFRNVTRTIGRTFDKSNVAQADVTSLR